MTREKVEPGFVNMLLRLLDCEIDNFSRGAIEQGPGK